MNVATAPAAPAAGKWLDPIYAPWKGNASEMARDIEEDAVLTNQWRFRGRIPERYWEKIIVKAASRGFVLTHRDFINPEHRVAGAAS
jgi:hypothetical protein